MDEGSEKTLQKIFEVAPVGMLLLGENMDVIQANSTLGTMILREPSEIIGKRGGEGLECIHSKEDPRGCGFSNSCPNCPLRNGVELVLKSGDTIRNAEFQPTLLIDGKEISPWLSINTEPIILEGKKHVIVALSDITEQKRVEEALRKSESFQRSIVAAFPDYLFILDTEGTIQKVNRVQAGHREQDVVGQKAVKFMPPEYREDFEGALRQAVDTGQIQAVETMVDLPDGCHWFFNRLSPTTLDGEEESIVLIAIDITERKRAENKMQEYLEEIESINEKLDAYSYSISHDLKEP
ncbi:MAG: PAS domain S-box protein, partial [Proteobacteria bacterium]|nr:PAS domain S-box protein [Pseudomonadota bacterium]